MECLRKYLTKHCLILGQDPPFNRKSMGRYIAFGESVKHVPTHTVDVCAYVITTVMLHFMTNALCTHNKCTE